MSARMRHGVVDSSTATTVDVSLDGVIVTAFLLDGVVLTAGMTATLVQDGRRLVAVGGIASGSPQLLEAGHPGADPFTLADLADNDNDTYGRAITTTDPFSPLVIFAFGWVVGGTQVEWPGAGDLTVTITARLLYSANTDYRAALIDDGDVEVWTGTIGTDWTTITITLSVPGVGWVPANLYLGRATDDYLEAGVFLDIAEFDLAFTPA